MNAIDCQVALLFLLIALAVAATLSSPGFEPSEDLEPKVMGRAAQWTSDKRIAQLVMRNMTRLGWTIGCGHAPGRVRLDARSLGSLNASFGEYPSFVRIETLGQELQCGGVLISSHHVLAAAHCIRPKDRGKQLRLRFGAIYSERRDSSEMQIDMTVTAENVCTSPKFNPSKYTSDWQIIELPKAVILNDNIQPACLPSWSERVRTLQIFKNGTESECFLIGMGSSVFHSNLCTECREYIKKDPRLRLQKFRLESSNCSEVTKGDPPDPSRVCYVRANGNVGLDACWSDAGGPVVCKNADGLWTVIAILARGAVRYCDNSKLAESRYTDVQRLIYEMHYYCRHFPGKRQSKHLRN